MCAGMDVSWPYLMCGQTGGKFMLSRWIQASGASECCEHGLEISPKKSYYGEGLEFVSGRTFTQSWDPLLQVCINPAWFFQISGYHVFLRLGIYTLTKHVQLRQFDVLYLCYTMITTTLSMIYTHYWSAFLETSWNAGMTQKMHRRDWG